MPKKSYLMDDDDIVESEDSENAEIMRSIKSAEKMMGKKMGTPKALPRVANRPIMYDVEQSMLQLGETQTLNNKLAQFASEIENEDEESEDEE